MPTKKKNYFTLLTNRFVYLKSLSFDKKKCVLHNKMDDIQAKHRLYTYANTYNTKLNTQKKKYDSMTIMKKNTKAAASQHI